MPSEKRCCGFMVQRDGSTHYNCPNEAGDPGEPGVRRANTYWCTECNQRRIEHLNKCFDQIMRAEGVDRG